MNTYIVLGRCFNERLHAVTFAKTQAEEMDQTVEVTVETTDIRGRRRRMWMCRMHPPGVQRTIIPARVYPHAISA